MFPFSGPNLLQSDPLQEKSNDILLAVSGQRFLAFCASQYVWVIKYIMYANSLLKELKGTLNSQLKPV